LTPETAALAANRRKPAKKYPVRRSLRNQECGTMANQLGKRYMCEKCGTEVLCNKPGSGALECCEAEMKIKEAKALPSSD
jgi:hypothetical protein